MSFPSLLRSISMKIHVYPIQRLACTSNTFNNFHQRKAFGVEQVGKLPLIQKSALNHLLSDTRQNVSLTNVKEFATSPQRLSSHGHDHTKLWTAEKALSISLLGVVPAAFIFPSQAMDCILAVTLVMHNHWGVEANVIDYIRPIIFGPVIPKVAQFLIYGLSVATLTGLFYFTFNDVGLVNGIRMLWKL